MSDAISKSVKFDETKNQVKELDVRNKKHTLESDEEYDGDDYDRLQDDEIEGQEDDTIAHDGEITITPFNMKEEMQTGHFDKTGTYIFDKEDDIKDGWMDNIDWVKVKKREVKSSGENDSDDDSETGPEPIDTIQVYKEMVELMKSGESVAKAIRRLGGGNKKMTSAQRLKAKKMKIEPTEEEKINKDNLQKLTGLADKLVQTGNMEVYEETYEKIVYKLEQQRLKEEAAKTQIPDDCDDDDALDMFADSFDVKKQKLETSIETAEKETASGSHENGSGEAREDNSVMWEYKLNEESTEIHGPYTSEYMVDWKENSRHAASAVVRKVGADSFYNSRRIDFDLYT